MNCMMSLSFPWSTCQPYTFSTFLFDIFWLKGKRRFIFLFLFLFSCNLFLYSLGKIGEHAQHNDAILLVIVPASQASEISSSRALKTAKEYDPDSEYITIFIIGTLH